MIAIGYISNTKKMDIEIINRYSEMPEILAEYEKFLKLKPGCLSDLMELNVTLIKRKNKNNETFVFFCHPVNIN